MSPVSQADGHDDPGLVDELVPSVTAMINDLLVGPEDPVRQPVVTNELPDVLDGVQLRRSRRERQERDLGGHLQTGFNSGDRGGSGRSVILAGTFSLGETCQPAWSSSSTACAPGATAWLTSSNWAAIASVSQEGTTRPAPVPLAGQIAPKM